jgi:hypothetical protein
MLSPTRYDRARQKGGPASLVAFAGGGITAAPLPGFGIAPALRAGVRTELGGDLGLRIHAEVARKDVSDDGLRYSFWSASGAAALVIPLLDGTVFLEGGLLGGYTYASQSVSAGASYTGGGPIAGGVLQATTRLGSIRLGLDLQAEARFFRLNDAAVVRPGASLSLVALFSP